jgi:hypothetical protein
MAVNTSDLYKMGRLIPSMIASVACLGTGAIWAESALAEPSWQDIASGTNPGSFLVSDGALPESVSFQPLPETLGAEQNFEPEAILQNATTYDGPSTGFLTEAAALELSSTTEGDVPFWVFDANDKAEAVSQATVSNDEIPWRFVLEPYLYLPLSTSGDITVRNTEVPYDFDLGEVLESLTFAFYGRFEAWKGPWALMLDSYYFNTVESDSTQVTVPPDLVGQLPPQVRVDGRAETAFFKIDVAGAYRFGDGNLASAFSTADTEFDLGPFVFDAIAGLRIYSFDNDVKLTSDIGISRDFGASNTFVEPMIGGRARWNFSDNLAAIVAANISGFGIGTDISVESYAGVDWLFSGNTSLTATYRLTYIDYSAGSSGFNLFQHGPTLGVKFRF